MRLIQRISQLTNNGQRQGGQMQSAPSTSPRWTLRRHWRRGAYGRGISRFDALRCKCKCGPDQWEGSSYCMGRSPTARWWMVVLRWWTPGCIRDTTTTRRCGAEGCSGSYNRASLRASLRRGAGVARGTRGAGRVDGDLARVSQSPIRNPAVFSPPRSPAARSGTNERGEETQCRARRFISQSRAAGPTDRRHPRSLAARTARAGSPAITCRQHAAAIAPTQPHTGSALPSNLGV